MWKIEDVKGNGAKTSIHFHMVWLSYILNRQDHVSSDDESTDNTSKLRLQMIIINRVWCDWRDGFNKLVTKHASYKEFDICLREAQGLIDRYGNPHPRFFSSINRLKSMLNSVNAWRGKVHDLLNSTRFISNDELNRLLNDYNTANPSCDEKNMLEHLIVAKTDLEKEVENG